MKRIIKIFLFSLLGLILIQFIPIDFNNPPVKTTENFINIEKTPEKIEFIIKKSCYDCHSNETIYPQYAKIAPISWTIKNNVSRGRKHLNFSIWGSYNQDLKNGMLKKAISTIEDGKMPKKEYIARHPEAQLSEKEKKLLIQYLEEVYNKINLKNIQ